MIWSFPSIIFVLNNIDHLKTLIPQKVLTQKDIKQHNFKLNFFFILQNRLTFKRNLDAKSDAQLCLILS